MSITQGLHRAVNFRSNQIATIHNKRRQTWHELAERVARVAGALSELGVQQDDRVAILALNSDRYVEYFYAAAWAGAVCNPVNIRLSLPEISHILIDSNSKILFVDDTFAPLVNDIRETATNIEEVIFIGDRDAPPFCLDYEGLIANCSPVEDARVSPEEMAGLFYTGGTTGKSKGVVLTHANLTYNALNVIPALKYDEKSIYLHAGPMFHLADMASTFAVTMVGATHASIPRFQVTEALQSISDIRVTHTLLVPTMINLLVSSGEISNYDTSSLKHMLYGASPMPKSVLEDAMRQLPSVNFTQGYGQTEASPLLTFLSSDDHKKGGDILKSAGRAAYGVEVKILDEEDKPLPNGQIGEICARGGNVMRAYWKLAKETERTLRNGWLHTGDLGYQNEDGYLFIVDRSKDMIITGGENVFSVEVEGAIYRYPGVQECAVIGIPDSEWGEAVHAIVVPKEGIEINTEGLKQFCRNQIASYKVPRSVALRSEPLPISGAGKVLKQQLRKPYWENTEKSIS